MRVARCESSHSIPSKSPLFLSPCCSSCCSSRPLHVLARKAPKTGANGRRDIVFSQIAQLTSPLDTSVTAQLWSQGIGGTKSSSRQQGPVVCETRHKSLLLALAIASTEPFLGTTLNEQLARPMKRQGQSLRVGQTQDVRVRYRNLSRHL